MSPEELKLWVGIISGVVALIVSVVSYLRQPSKDNAVKLDEQGKQIDMLTRRVDRNENQIKHMPTKDEFSDLRLAVANTNGELKAISTSMVAIGHTVQNIDEALRKGARHV